MKHLKYWLISFVFSFSCITLPAHAEDTTTHLQEAVSLEQLLQRISTLEHEKNKQFDARLERFRDEQKKRQGLLKQAQKQQRQAQALTKKLNTQFNDNKKRIGQLKKELNEKSGNLGELFGAVKQNAGDLRAQFENSFITPQYPERLDVVDQLAASSSLPDIKQLAALWQVLQEEMTASAEIVTFNATVVNPEGEASAQSVTRIGNFSAFHQDDYLLPQQGQTGFIEIGRQPGKGHNALLMAFNNANEEINPVSIDPSRGAILSLLVQRPTVQERVAQGGYIGYVIIAIGILGLVIVIERLLYLSAVRRRVKRQLTSNDADLKNPLGRVLAVYQNNSTLGVEALELKLDEAILSNIPKLERGVTAIKVLAAVAPLLGLLGTVAGMIQTFQAITLFGTGDPKLMAGGISEALVTTMLGLIVAIPLILAHSMISQRSRRLIKVMEEQSTGYIARHAEHADNAEPLQKAA